VKAGVSVALFLAIAVAIGLVQRAIPDADRIYRPITTAGAVKEDVGTVTYTVRVDTVRTARIIQVDRSFGEPAKHTTGGVWVVLGVRATATKEQVGLGEVVLRSPAGKTYATSDRLLGLESEALQPGLPRSGVLCFELPPAEAAGATLMITKPRYSGLARLNGALGPGVEIDLGLTEDMARRPAPAVSIPEGEI
jgi:hypothetical protein